MNQHTSDLITQSTQPVVFSVAGLTFFGVTVQDWVLVGTVVLLVLNLSLAAQKWVSIWSNHDADDE